MVGINMKSVIVKLREQLIRWGLKRLVTIGVLAFVLVGAGFILGQQRAHMQMKDAHGQDAHGTLYQCPMHPTYVSDKPGECPICGMTLVPIEQEEQAGDEHVRGAHEVEGYASIKLAPQRQQLIGVKTEAVRRRSLTRTINTVGWIAYDPDLYHVQAEYLAAIEGFKKIEESAIPEIRERAEKLVESARLRLRLLGLNDEQIDRLAEATEPDERLLLGDALDSVWLYATVYEYELQLVEEGDPVEVEARAFPGEVFTGTVQSIDTVLDPTTRSAKIRVIIQNPKGELKPQMFANARIEVSLGEHLAVPKEAVIDTGTRKVVFVDQGEGRFVPHDVRLGHKAEGYYAVLAGLEEGQHVVTSGNFLIDSESKLRAATKAAVGGHHH